MSILKALHMRILTCSQAGEMLEQTFCGRLFVKWFQLHLACELAYEGTAVAQRDSRNDLKGRWVFGLEA